MPEARDELRGVWINLQKASVESSMMIRAENDAIARIVGPIRLIRDNVRSIEHPLDV